MTTRRTFVTSAICSLGLPKALKAQSARPPGTIGYLHPVTISREHASFKILGAAWRQRGYVEGESIHLRSGESDPARLPRLVAELIAAGSGVLIVVGAEAVRVAVRVTSTLPIVAIDLETDPVRSGLIASYGRPGGNVTGLFLDQSSLAGKWMELLREAVPGLDRIAIAWTPSTGTQQLAIAEGAAKSLNIETVIVEVTTSDDFDIKFSRLAGPKRTGIVQLTAPGFATVSTAYAAAAIKYKLPTMTFLKSTAKGGVLMSYGPNQEHYFPRAVNMAEKILNGEKPGDIPIERPSRFEFVLNLKTAKALGLTFPPSILVQADEVIE